MTTRRFPDPTAVNVSSTRKFRRSFAAAARALDESRTRLVTRVRAASRPLARPSSPERPSPSRRATEDETRATTVTRHASEHDIDTSMPRRRTTERVGTRSEAESASREAGVVVASG